MFVKAARTVTYLASYMFSQPVTNLSGEMKCCWSKLSDRHQQIKREGGMKERGVKEIDR
jgi:hypothetical protein